MKYYQICVWKWLEKAVNGLIQLTQTSHMFWQAYDKIGDIIVLRLLLPSKAQYIWNDFYFEKKLNFSTSAILG